jgi:hypothetical protein
MATQVSRVSLAGVSTDGVTYTTVGQVQGDIRLEISGTDIDITTHGTDTFTSTVPGRASAKMSFACLYDETDAGQTILRTSAYARTKLYYRYRPVTNTGNLEYIAQGALAGCNTYSGQDDVVRMDLSVTLDQPTATAQS